MKAKRFLALLLCFVMVLSVFTVTVNAEENTVNVKVCISRYGEFVTGKDNESLMLTQIELSGKESYTIDDTLKMAHELYFDGEDGYLSEESTFGLSLKKLWGDESGNFGYQVNGGTESVMGLDHQIEDGDVIEAVIYKNLYPDTEAYAKFENYSEETTDEITLTLYSVSGYDENFNSVFSPCPDAVITVNGEKTESITDENGKVTLDLQEGSYIISAVKTKTVNEEEVPAICASVCMVEVKEDKPLKALNNIAAKLSKLEICEDANMQWIIADLASYKTLYPETENVLSEEVVQKCLDKIIKDTETATTPSALAKDILALRALGYDPQNLYNENSEKVDALAKLIKLVDEKAESVTNIYTLPYVLIALQQGENYMTSEQETFLIDAALLNKDAWQSTQWGTDGLTPMILALAPYIENEDVKAVIDEAVEIINAEKNEDGSMGGNSASTGLTIAACSALGTGAQEFVDGLMLYANENADGFLPEENLFSTEQGFRGLLAWYHLKEQTGKRVYDFKDMPLNEGKATVAPKEEDRPSSGGGSTSTDIKVNVKVMIHKKDLCNNSYSYKYNKDKYEELINTNVSAEKGASVFDVLIKALDQEEKEYVASKGYVQEIDGTGEFDHGAYSGWMYVLNEKYVNVGAAEKTVAAGDKVTWFYTDDYTKEKGSENYRPSGSDGGGGGVSKPVVKEEVKEEAKEPVKSFDDVEKDSWYSEGVDYVLNNKLMKGESETEFKPENKMTRAMLVTVLYRMAGEPETEKELVFKDVEKDSWYSKGVAWATEQGIVSGHEDNTFKGDENITREQLAVILYRFAQGAENENCISKYEDADKVSPYAKGALNWAVENKLINGVSEMRLAPSDTATRAQIALVIMRYAELIKGAKQ